MSDTSTFRVVPANGQTTLCLEGSVGAAQAVDLQSALRSELDGENACVLDWSQATHVDGCILQLIYAFGTAVRARGRKLSQNLGEQGTPRFLAQSGMASVFANLVDAGASSTGRSE